MREIDLNGELKGTLSSQGDYLEVLTRAIDQFGSRGSLYRSALREAKDLLSTINEGK